MNLQQKKELIRFIDFHSRARSLNQNSIQAIVSADDTKAGLMEIFDLLNKDVAVIGYSGSVKPTKFIEELVWALYEGKTVLIETDTLDFDPVVYDQLLQLRDKNRLTLNFAQTVPVSPLASIFLLYQNGGEDKRIFEIADHVFNLKEVN